MDIWTIERVKQGGCDVPVDIREGGGATGRPGSSAYAGHIGITANTESKHGAR